MAFGKMPQLGLSNAPERAKMRLLTFREVLAVLSTRGDPLAGRTVQNWLSGPNPIIRPTVPARGSGHYRGFALVPDVLALCVARHLKLQGFTLDAASNVFTALTGIRDEAALLALFAQGETCLLMIGTEAYPRLVSRETLAEMIRDQADDPIFQTARRERPELLPYAVDIEAIYRGIVDALDKLPKLKRVRSMEVPRKRREVPA